MGTSKQATEMVLLHVKKGDDINFLFRTPVTTSNAEATAEVVKVWNLVLKIRRLKYCCDELCQFGPMKPPEKQGYIDEEEAMQDNEARAKADPHFDPTGRRTGALMIAFPAGLPDWEPARLETEGIEDLEGTAEGVDVMSETNTIMWWASKQLEHHKTLADFVGKNDKTKIVVQLTKKGAGAPMRTGQQQSKDEQEAQMAYYFKKKEEWKKLEEEDDDSYMSSQWANPKAMKSQ